MHHVCYALMGQSNPHGQVQSAGLEKRTPLLDGRDSNATMPRIKEWEGLGAPLQFKALTRKAQQ